MTKGLVTVFGGSGFIGRYVVRQLAREGWRIRVATRSPHTAQDLKVMGRTGQIQLVQANLRFKTSVERALEGADAVVNLVGILFEQGRQKFSNLHSQGAAVVAEAAAARGIKNFVQISAIGADKDSESEYARTKAAGEQAVRDSLPEAVILRPSIVFGPEDEFFNRFAGMTAMAPALPLIGGGNTRFQPVYVGDVAEAVGTALSHTAHQGQTFELGGPQTYTFKALLEFILKTVDRRRFLAPLPWFAARIMGFFGEMAGKLPFVKPFLTRDQVANLRVDNVVSETAKGFAELGIKTESIEAIVPTYLARYRKYGQFHEDEVQYH